METIQSQFITELLGTAPIEVTIATLFWAVVGATIAGGVVVWRGMSKSGRTPKEFRLGELVNNPKNALRTALTVLCVLVSVRFLPELFSMEITSYSGLLIGLASGGLVEFFVNKQNKILSK